MKQHLKTCAVITLGCVIYALAFDWFAAPNQFTLGGVTGVAQALHHWFPPLSVGALSVLMNVPLFLAGWRKIGGHLLVSSLYAMVVSSAAIDALGLLFPFAPMDPMLAALCGGVLMGLGLGLVFSQGATTGGTDIVARLLKLKFAWLPMGKLMLAADAAVLALAVAAFGQAEAALYGAVALFASSRVMDVVLYGTNASKVAYIISAQWREIAGTLMTRQDRGVTILRGQGAYTGEEKQVLMVAFKQREIVEIKQLVHDLDPRAFLIVCDAKDVLGEGFRQYRRDEI